MAKEIFTIVNNKGGVGKTTTALNLGAAFYELGYNVLLIDTDPQMNLSKNLGYSKVDKQPTIYEALCGRSGLIIRKRGSETKSKKRFDYIPASPDLVNVEIELFKRISKEYILKRLLEPIKDQYDYIIFDCPPSLGITTINSMTASTGLIIPVQCEPYAIEGISEITSTYLEVRNNVNSDLKIKGYLLTMVHNRLVMTAQFETGLRETFKELIFKSKINHNVSLSEAQGKRQTIYEYKPSSTGAKDYMEFAKEIINQKR